MFHVRTEHIRRVSFVTRLFPKLKSPIGLDTNKLKSSLGFDGELFCGGRSKNKDLLTYFGYISDPSDSCATFIQLPGFRRSLKKLINIVEQELETLGAQEVLLPTLVLQKLWHKSKRLERQQDALENVYKFTDDAGNKLLLGPTFEESITRMVAEGDSISESQLPLLLYQTSPKFRFEPNPRFGILRCNEFFMNDLYSFDADSKRATQTYDKISEAYNRIFQQLGLNCVRIQSGTGNIGGKYSHEYQLPVSSGEDTIVKCNNCQHAYNIEMCSENRNHSNDIKDICLSCGSSNINRTKALELGHTFLLSDTYSSPLNAKYASLDGKSRVNFEMGCYGLGLTRILGAGIDLFSLGPTDEASNGLIQLRWPNQVEPYKFGLIVPAKRSKQHQGGSTEFIERLVGRVLESTKNIDILIEDRDKEGISRRLIRLQSLGIPNIIVVGQRFLQDQPEVELLKLDSGRRRYEQYWFTEDQLCDYIMKLDK